MPVWKGENFYESSSGEPAADICLMRSNSADFVRDRSSCQDRSGTHVFAANTFSRKLPAGQRMLIIAVTAVFLWSALLAALQAAT